MSTDDSNPYQPSTIEPKQQSLGLEYMRAVNYVFESPKWVANLLWGSLCILSTQVIPIVGQLVLIGYQFEVVESLATTSRTNYPDFDTNKVFKEYILRGMWVFLVMLVLALVFVPIILIFLLVGGGVIGGVVAATDGNQDATAIGVIITIVLLAIGFFIFWIGAILYLTPFMLRAGLTQDFRASFDLAWARDFVRRVWLETLLSTLFFVAVMIVAEVLGLLACVVGVFPAVTFAMLVQSHLWAQLYRIYLAKGGQKVPLKSPPIQPAQAV